MPYGSNSKVVTSHTTFVEGTLLLANRVAEIEGVRQVTVGSISRRGSRQRRMRVTVTTTSVKIVWSGNNGHQSLFVLPENGLGLEELAARIKNSIDKCGNPRRARVPREEESVVGRGHPERETDARVAPPAVDEKTKKEEVMTTQIYRFAIKASEARLILEHLIEEGRLVREIVGGRSKFCPALWVALIGGGYVKSRSRGGRNASATTDVELFVATRFMLAPEDKKRFKSRWKRPQELAENEQTEVPADQFIQDLTRIAGNGNTAHTPRSAPVSVSAPPPESLPDFRALRERLDVEMSHLRAELVALQVQLEPGLRRRTELQKAIEAIERDQNELARAEVLLQKTGA